MSVTAVLVTSENPAQVKVTTELEFGNPAGSFWSSDENKSKGYIEIPETVSYNEVEYTVTTIGMFAFKGCDAVKGIDIPKTVTNIETHTLYGTPFDDCVQLEYINVSGSDSYSSQYGVLYNKDQTELIRFPPAKANSYPEWTIQDNVEVLKTKAFYQCRNLKSVVTPNSLLVIEDECFSGCSNLETATLGSSLVNLGFHIFDGCPLTSVISKIENINSVTTNAAAFSFDLNKCILTIPTGKIDEYENKNHWKDFGTITEEKFKIGDYYYRIVSFPPKKEVEIVKVKEEWSHIYDERPTSITLPETIEYRGTTYNVTKIGYRVFYQWDKLTSITLPNTLTTIGKNAFCDCSALTSIELPNSVTEIKAGAFIRSGLTSITFPNSLTTIGRSAFSGCPLTSITLPNSVKNVEKLAFYECNSLTTVTLSNGMKAIEKGTFADCKALTTVNIPTSITTIKEGAFRECSSLSSITFPNTLTTIESWAFYQSGLTSITLPESITSLAQNSIRDCANLTYVELPNNSLNYNFRIRDCPNIKIIASHNKNPIDATYVFQDVRETCTLFIPKGTREAYENTGGWKDFKTIIEMEEVGNKFVVDGIKYEITNYSVREEEKSTVRIFFQQEMNLSGDVVIPETVTYNEKTYEVTGFVWQAFADCVNVTSITLPSTIEKQKKDANFARNAKSLTAIYVDENNEAYSSEDGVLFNKSKTRLLQYPINKQGTDYTVPNTVDSIVGGAFHHCKHITNVTIAENSVIHIGQKAFSNCKELQSITLPNSLKMILFGAFENCTKLTSIDIPNSVTALGNGVFSESGLTSVSIPETITELPYHIFQNCKSLQSVELPNTLTKIDDEAFWGCTALTSVVIPENVFEIGAKAFLDCSALTTITSEIKNLDDLIMKPEVFKYVDKANCTLKVPAGTKEAYQNTDQWKDFQNIVEMEEEKPQIGDKIKKGKLWYKVISVENHQLKVIGNRGIPSQPMARRVMAENGYSFASVVIPSEVTYKGETFTVTTIGASAFANSTDLNDITIPKTVTSIEDNAFENCTSLKFITLKTENINAVQLGNDVFKGVDKSSCTLKVPKEKTETYENADQWKDFGNIEENNTGIQYTKLTNPISVVGNNITVSQVLGKRVKLYNLSGQVLYNLNATQDNITLSVNKSGVYILQVGNATRVIKL